MYNVLLTVNLIIFISFSNVIAETNRTLPEGFLIGLSTSAYQTEGAWNEDGKSENIWDHWIHTNPLHIENNDTADVASDFYHRYSNDIILASLSEVNHFQFSIPWSRILPTGMNTSVNTKAIEHYQKLIDSIRYSEMIPVGILYYHDLPQSLQELGGWTNPDIVDYFVGYARVVFQYFSKVQYWITFNDPKTTCRLGYGLGTYAPGIANDGVDDYKCSYVILKAHAAAYHMYKEEFPNLKARISIAIDMEWSEPFGSRTEEIEAAERRNLFEFGIYAHPIFLGNWPQVVIDRVGNRSEGEKLPKSRLPEFTPEEINHIKGTADFMAINHYSTRLVLDVDEEPLYGDPSYMKDMRVVPTVDPTWSFGADDNAIVPWGIRKALKWIKEVYNDPEIFITENGVADDQEWDTIRINFITDYLLAILDAVYEDKVKVFGYTVRSFLDSFEWTKGYSQKFGIFGVNFSDPRKERRMRRSIYLILDIVTSRSIPSEATTTQRTTSTTEAAASKLAVYSSLTLFVIYFCLLLV